MKRWRLTVPLFLLIFAIPAGAALAPGSPRVEGTPPASPVTIEVDRTGFVKGVYASYAALGSTDFIDHVKQLVADTELNAIVIDFKGDYGLLTFPSEVPLAQNIGADAQVMIQDPGAFLAWFKERGVYVIARIVAFKDNVLAEGVPDWAVTDSATGGAWRDQEGMAWVDPLVQSAWVYNADLAAEAAAMGFDEVQFDYMRFPTDGNMGRVLLSQASTEESRTAAIVGLLRTTREALEPYGVRLGADVFGYTAWVEDDLGIGQHIESLAPYVDVLSPMAYPSTYSMGLPGEDPAFHNAIAYPYEIVYLTTQHAVERLHAANPAAEVRPWIQNFQDYAFDGRTYTPAELRRQMVGARLGGSRGWMLWDPAVRYTRQGLVSATPAFPPNLRGKVMVLAYSEFTAADSADETRNARSTTTFRNDLEQLLAAGFYPINLRDLARGDFSAVPAGKRPMVLTFDGSSAEQFRLLPGGAVDPACAVGVLLAFHNTHTADWPLRGTFFVRYDGGEPADALFGTADLALTKLELLISWGMEIGIHVAREWQTEVSSEGAASAVGRAQLQLSDRLAGYRAVSLSVEEARPIPASWRQGEIDGAPYAFEAGAWPAGGAAFTPLSAAFDPFRIPRVRVADVTLGQAMQEAERSGGFFVSAGE